MVIHSGVARGCLKASVTVAQQHANRTRATYHVLFDERAVAIRNRQVELAIGVKISRHHRLGKRVPGRIAHRRTEAPVPVSQQDTHDAIRSVRTTIEIGTLRDRQIELAVMIEVPHRHRLGLSAARRI